MTVRLSPKEVYPRVYGGTVAEKMGIAPSTGLSPRVRGNRRIAALEQPKPRSIPACTGEPRYRNVNVADKKVDNYYVVELLED